VTYPVTAPPYTAVMAQDDLQLAENHWISFPGGELEGQRPKVLCPACRDALNRAAAAEHSVTVNESNSSAAVGDSPQNARHPRTLCFQCYRADLERHRSLMAAGQLNTATTERFQGQLPFEVVDNLRLQMLKAERTQARVLAASGPGGCADRRRRAQIAARHALESAITGCRERQPGSSLIADRARAVAAAIHAAELQLPESWLPFVVSR
jgi:hypothetical protein